MSTGGDVGSAQALSHELEDSGYLFARDVELLDDLVDAQILEVLYDRGDGVRFLQLGDVCSARSSPRKVWSQILVLAIAIDADHILRAALADPLGGSLVATARHSGATASPATQEFSSRLSHFSMWFQLANVTGAAVEHREALSQTRARMIRARCSNELDRYHRAGPDSHGIGGTRVTLDALVAAFDAGATAEAGTQR